MTRVRPVWLWFWWPNLKDRQVNSVQNETESQKKLLSHIYVVVEVNMLGRLTLIRPAC